MQKVLNYFIEDHESVKVVHLVGNISNTTRKEFQALVDQLIQKNNVIINLINVALVTSSGLNTLIDVCLDARKKNKRVILLGAKIGLIRMIEVLDVYEYFIFVDSIEEGQTKLKYFL